MSSWNAPPPTYDAHSTLTPYLQLPHLLSLTWLAYPILSLLFVAFRLQLSIGDAENAVASAKDNIVSACKAAEEAATSAASMPRYMALATNEQFADAVNASMRAARAALVLSLTAMEGIINFIIDLYRSTLLCFLELVVRGGLAILIGAVDEVNQLLQTVTSALRTSIQNEIASASNIINTAIDGINRVNPFTDIPKPNIPVPNLDGLANVSLPPTIQQALTNLNASIPSVGAIKDKLEDVINTPFELLKKDINDTFATFNFDSSVLPVPAQNNLLFCNKMDTSVIDDVGRDIIKTAKIGIILLFVVALILIGLNCLLTWYKWRCMKSHLMYTRQAWMTDPTITHVTTDGAPTVTLTDHNLMILNANSEHPLISRIVNQLSSMLRLSPSQHTNLQWFLNYIFHAPALACFMIGFFGLICVQIQLLAIGPIAAKYQERAAATAADFSNTIAASINESMFNQSAAYAAEVNGRVDAIQTSLNQGIFGWVDGTTSTLNNTINEFYTDVQTAVNTVFGGTILESAANEFLRCFIGSKVDAIENALTFLHDNLKVDMPRVNESVLVLSPASVNEATQPIAAAAIGGGSSDDQGLIGRLVLSYEEALKKERVMFGIFLGLWGVVVLMGLGMVLWHSYGKPATEARKRKRYEAEQRSFEDYPAFGSMEKKTLVDESGAAWAARTYAAPVVQPLLTGEPLKARDGLMAKDQEAQSKMTRMLALGKQAFSKDRPDVPPKDTEEQVPGSWDVTHPMGTNNRNTTWFNKMGDRLRRKPSQESDGSADYWESHPAGAAKREDPRRMTVESQTLVTDAPPPASRWSTTPPAARSSWRNILVPTKKTPPFPPVPVRPQRSLNPNVPLDVVEDPFASHMDVNKPVPHTIPVPLYSGFDSQQQLPHSLAPPPRHPSSRHSRSVSSNAASPWRVTNAMPGEISDGASSNASLRDSFAGPTQPQTQAQAPGATNSRYLTASHGRQPSLVNPFITPFDDEHQVKISRDPDAHLRKSLKTSPYGVAM